MNVIACIAVLGVIVLHAVDVSSQNTACNDYIDQILNDLKQEKELFQDPYEIQEKTIEVHKKVLFINYTGEASIYDGHIFGLNSLHRDGDVIVDKKKSKHLKIYLGAGELKLQSSGKIKLMGHGPQVKVDAKIAYVNFKLDIIPSTDGSNPKIANFKIEDIKGTEVKATGLGPLNFFLNSYIKIIGTFFKGLVRNAIESRLKIFMEKKLKKYVVPEECLNEALFGSLRI